MEHKRFHLVHAVLQQAVALRQVADAVSLGRNGDTLRQQHDEREKQAKHQDQRGRVRDCEQAGQRAHKPVKDGEHENGCARAEPDQGVFLAQFVLTDKLNRHQQ